MSKFLIPLSSLTVEDINKCKKFQDNRYLYHKYTSAQLDNWIKVDFYEALDLDAYRDSDIPSEILNYCIKKKSVMYHPTKNQGKHQAFLIIGKAKEILGNNKLRKLYDSCYLDESIPEDRDYSPEEFYEVFDDVFIRNGLFSEIKPVPRIRENTDVFYKFWLGFKSNRVYDDPEDVFDVSGSCRRYNAEKNKDIVEEKRLEDLRRIQRLVKLAIKLDPRLKKSNIETEPWDAIQLKSLIRFDSLTSKSAARYDIIAKKLNEIYLTKRKPSEIKNKLESVKKK